MSVVVLVDDHCLEVVYCASKVTSRAPLVIFICVCLCKLCESSVGREIFVSESLRFTFHVHTQYCFMV